MYDMQPPQPVQMPVREEKKRMSVPQIMLIVLALAFVIWYLVTSLAPETAPYAQITAGVIGARYTGDCLIVRDETPFDEEGVSNVEYLAEEGTYVSIGDDVCKVYNNGFRTQELETLQDRDQYGFQHGKTGIGCDEPRAGGPGTDRRRPGQHEQPGSDAG